MPQHEHGYVYSYRCRRRVALELVQHVAQPGATVLDVGAAQGNFTLSLAELGYDVTWNDLRAELADYVRLKHESGAVRYRPGEVFQLPRSEQYDVVLATEIIEHVAHPDDFLKKLRGFAKPHGFVVLTTPNGAYFRNRLPRFTDCHDPSRFESRQFEPDADGHIFLLYPEEIERLADRSGLKLIELRLFSSFLVHGWLGTYRLLQYLPESSVLALDRLMARAPSSIRKRVATDMAVVLGRA
jgi:2-polyprenyl-6-hydroxyphenyl methylase/3-demethylubiquinone-9 3-methyltransferase